MKIAVLLSGGVDSSVALALLHRAGHTITPFYCKIWLEEESFGATCPWEEDLSYANAICDQFDLDLNVHPMQSIYYDTIITYVVSQLKQGFTPNPDMLCNQYIKFGAFAEAHGAAYEKIASGHYAQVIIQNDAAYLHTAFDPVKDQSYFLARLSQNQLKKACFPLGTMTKQEVRKTAKSFGLATATRKDSQGICFLGKISYPDFVRHYLGTKKGAIRVFETKEKLGEHQGYWFHTIGQRQGLGLSGGPWYVCAKDVQENIVYVQHVTKLNQANRPFFVLNELEWIPDVLDDSGIADVKIRHGRQFHRAAYVCSEDKKNVYLACFDQEKGLAPGQFAVLYLNGYARASGCISHVLDQEDPVRESLLALLNAKT